MLPTPTAEAEATAARSERLDMDMDMDSWGEIHASPGERLSQRLSPATSPASCVDLQSEWQAEEEGTSSLSLSEAAAATATVAAGDRHDATPLVRSESAAPPACAERDVAWLLSTLRMVAADSSLDRDRDRDRDRSCGEAWNVLKQLTKFAPDKFWEKNCAQVRGLFVALPGDLT